MILIKRRLLLTSSLDFLLTIGIGDSVGLSRAGVGARRFKAGFSEGIVFHYQTNLVLKTLDRQLFQFRPSNQHSFEKKFHHYQINPATADKITSAASITGKFASW